jgi:membrane protease YdiL (CAAX protease family)
MMIAPIPLWLAVVNVFILPVTTAFAEDGLYLGCGVNQIKNKYIAVLVPAFFFALQHSFIPTLFDMQYIIYRFLSFLPLTIILCWYYYKKKNPLPIMVGHTIIDVITVMQILATSAVPGLYEMMCSL